MASLCLGTKKDLNLFCIIHSFEPFIHKSSKSSLLPYDINIICMYTMYNINVFWSFIGAKIINKTTSAGQLSQYVDILYKI